MYHYETYNIPYEGTDVMEPLIATPELDDLIWLLDQCGFDEHVRAMPYKEIFMRMRHNLMGQSFQWDSSIECNILRNFLPVANSSFTEHSGHPITKHLFERLWQSISHEYSKANIIDYKMQKIAQGSAPIYAIKDMQLPDAVMTEGSRVALLLMFKIPQDFRTDFAFWAQKQALFEHLHALNPSHAFVKQELEKNTAEFQSLYRNANRKRKTNRRYRHNGSGNIVEFYESLHKYSYTKKCSIIRCLLETDLSA